VSQGRAPLSQPKVRKILDTTAFAAMLLRDFSPIAVDLGNPRHSARD
jgi:hypothetical protein